MSNNDDSRNVGLYIPLEITAPRHPKIRKLARRLKISKAAALGHMCTLWAEILSQSPDGYVADSESLEILADWDGNEGEFTDVAVSVGLVDQDGDAYRVHEYYDRLSHLRQVRQKKLTRDRVRKHRERKAQQNSDSRPCNANSVTDALRKVTGVTVHPEQEQEQKQQHPPHSTELDPSSDDTTTTESVGVDGDGFGSESIPDHIQVLDAVEDFETATAPEQPSEAHSEPAPAEEPNPVAETPQTPEETTTEATARAMVEALGVTIPTEPIEDDEQEQSHNGCSVVERKWAVGRDLDDLPDHEALTTLDVDKALRNAGYIRGATSTHAWGKLGKLHEASPLTAGELRSALRLAKDPKVGAHLPYMAGCVERRRQGLVTPPSTRPQSPASITVPRKVEAIHEYHERCKQAHLQEQVNAGLPPDEERADRAAFSGMPTDEDRERYHGANGRWENIDDRAAKAMAECMASVMAH